MNSMDLLEKLCGSAFVWNGPYSAVLNIGHLISDYNADVAILQMVDNPEWWSHYFEMMLM